ncbi:hypothetical protein [Brevibacillus brevis]|nr:hypothetical protein [Brevibacillus brevis]
MVLLLHYFYRFHFLGLAAQKNNAYHVKLTGIADGRPIAFNTKHSNKD